jgi:hypothetical protein
VVSFLNRKMVAYVRPLSYVRSAESPRARVLMSFSTLSVR